MTNTNKQAQARLKFFLLHYCQTQFLNSLLKEAKNFDPQLVSFELHDDGSPPEIQKQISAILSSYPTLKAVLHPSNRGVLATLEECLRNSQANYTYFGAGDDVGCPASMQRVLRDQKDGKNPLIVSDFYVIHAKNRSSIYVEAILPAQWMTGKPISSQDLEKTLWEGNKEAYIATHAAFAPTKALLSAGGFPAKMKWHCDWFAFHVAALRAGIQYVPTPLACWRQSASGYSHSARFAAKQEREVLREILSTLRKPEYSDVRKTILCPNMTPMLDNIARQTLLAILSRSKYWGFLRWGHFRNTLHEIAAPWISPERWGGKMLKWLDEVPIAMPMRFFRRFLLRLLLKLGGARVGHHVYFGRKIKIREPRGLHIGDNVTIGNRVSICAMHPLNIGFGTQIGDNVCLESANFSQKSVTRFLRKKSVIIGRNVVIGSDCVIGPGANISSFARIPSNEHVENVESSPLFFLDETDQIRVDHEVLRDWYGLDPRGVPVQHSEAMP